VVRLPLAGEHNARNAAATLAVAAALEVPLLAAAAGLEKAALPPHRSRIVAAGGRTILDDCYNANPASMTAALATVIASVGGSAGAFAILGDMLELGPESEALHRALGREAAFVGLAGLAAVGEFAAEVAAGAKEAGLTRTMITRDPEAAAAQVAEWSASGDWILVKASRGVRLERAVEALQAKLK
jgi:UDP-N-acetylmuramyl pentapeptide synthase